MVESVRRQIDVGWILKYMYVMTNCTTDIIFHLRIANMNGYFVYYLLLSNFVEQRIMWLEPIFKLSISIFTVSNVV